MDKTTASATMKTYSYLALGDSYTIGEQVLLPQSFPYQTMQFLRTTPSAVKNPDGGWFEDAMQTAAGAKSHRQGLLITAPEIIATTGHTTDELNTAINNTKLLPSYDYVSLLIGVNNQYRGRTVEDFESELEGLIQRAIQFAGNIPNHVFVLSIPDWGVTPFVVERDTAKIATEIDAYNLVCKNAAVKYETHFIDITTSQRIDGNKEEFLAVDKLHPSAKEYKKWAKLLAEKISTAL